MNDDYPGTWDDEIPSFAMGYVCVDLVKTLHDLQFPMRRVANRLGYHYIGLTKGSSLIVPEAVVDHVTRHRIELLIVPDLGHLRGRISPELVTVADIHDLSCGATYERPSGYRGIRE